MSECLLRDLQCRTAKPRKAVYRLRDGGGLFLQVRPNGLKYWQYRYTKPDRREGLIQIGPYPRVKLEQARNARNDHRAALSRGDDPSILRKQHKARSTAASVRALTFKQCAEAYIEARSAEWRSAKHEQQWVNSLKRYAFPILGPLRPQDIDTDILLRVLEPIWLTKNETASRVRGRIENVLDWAKVRRLRDGENPARWSGHLDQLLSAPSKVQKVKHHPALPYPEIGAFVTRLRESVSMPERGLEFAILTATRTNETLRATWSEFDLPASLWTIPAERMKANRDHRIPLSPAAVNLLKSLPTMGGEGVVFEGAKEGRPLSSMAFLQVLDRLGRDDVTPHGFRSTFRDWAAECTGFPSEVAEMALAHAIRDKTESAYRRGDLFEKRRDLMQAWADYINSHPQAAEDAAAEQNASAG